MAVRAPSPWVCVFLKWLGGRMERFSTKVVVTLPHPMVGALGEVCKSWLEATRDQRSRYVLLCMAADTLAPPHVHAMAVCARPPSPQVPPPTGHVQARLTQLTTLHIDQSPGITPAAFTVLMQSPQLHTVFLVEVDGYRLLVNTGVLKSIRELFLLDCKHIAPVLGHCPRLLTLEVHEHPILHNHRGGGRIHLPGGLCGLPDIGLLLPRSLQHLTLNAQGWPEDVYLRWHENPTMCGTQGGVALPSLKHLVLGSEQLREDKDSAISEAGVEALCRFFSSDSVKTLRLYSQFPLSAVMIACMGACWPFLEDVGLTVAHLRPSGLCPELQGQMQENLWGSWMRDCARSPWA
ncbi:hypothetical protein K439DRAFT_1614799 [Ramaria rubella]|nr:hypothetical protein K439DRAFT_1614799 [Ramaria rubella]